MTPLAMELLDDLYSEFHFMSRTDGLPGFLSSQRMSSEQERQHVGRTLRGVMQSCKCFELTAVYPLIGPLAAKMLESFEEYDRVDQRLAFLPAPITWIELEQPSLRRLIDAYTPNSLVFLTEQQWQQAQASYRYRTAFVFVGSNDSSLAMAQRFLIGYGTPRPPELPRRWNIQTYPPLPLVGSGLKPQRNLVHYNQRGEKKVFDKPTASAVDFWHYAMLALINSPRVIGQHTHFPHGRAEREVLKRRGLVGKFPLRAWTEIILQVAPNPKDRSGSGAQEAHLTGERCLHYCRTYLRVRHGLLEYVEGHWRGDPGLGIKRSRYRLKPEKQPSG